MKQAKQFQNTIYYIGGSKGGVGKSMISTVLIQFLLDRYSDIKTVHLIETDESNPDVGRIYDGKIPVTPIVLDERETGWITFFDILERSKDTLFIVNSAARSNYGIEKNGRNFSDALEAMEPGYDLVTFWPINRQLDCVNLLMDFLKAVQYGNVYTVRNNYWGEAKDFLIYDAMMQKPKNSEVAARIGGVLDFPALNDLITLQFYSYGKTIPEVAEKLNVFKRQIFLSWRSKAYEMFESTGLFDDTMQQATNES
ncbi:hypothetical protein LJC31_04425 [Synergistaceae bacterium OttesenSCG-928-I11]|nr:hypothetical protein [Synergistaceae bacterium OttesenSCG-928-I11]